MLLEISMMSRVQTCKYQEKKHWRQWRKWMQTFKVWKSKKRDSFKTSRYFKSSKVHAKETLTSGLQ